MKSVEAMEGPKRKRWFPNPVSLLDTGVSRTNSTAQSSCPRSDRDRSCPRIYVSDTLRKIENKNFCYK